MICDEYYWRAIPSLSDRSGVGSGWMYGIPIETPDFDSSDEGARLIINQNYM
jgi:hypothetical protein